MATTNGLTNGQPDSHTSPQLCTKSIESPPSPSGTKRKRSETETETETETDGTAAAVSTHVFSDLLELLQKHDPSPSVLNVTLSNASRLSKRYKIDDSDAPTNLVARLQNHLYTSLNELEHDLSDACQSLLEPIKAKDRLKNGQRLPVEDIKTMQRVSDFHQLAKGFLNRERSHLEPNKDSIKKELTSTSEKASAAGTQTKTVLSLFGNAPNPKQLFSSFQQQNKSIDGTDISLEELGLPNMLSATKVLPLQPEDALGTRKPNPTFADVFPPPASLPPLNPPKPSKHSSSKSSTISWSVGELPKPSRKAGYTLQPLTVGSWVAYGGVESKESVSALKRRRRESLLGGSDPPKPTEDLSTADAIAQEQALFRQAYSSFAPTQDNSKALVPQETKHRVWWHRLGQKRFAEHFVLDPALEESAFPPELERAAKEAAEEEAATIGGAEGLKEIEKAIEEYDDEAFKDKLDLVSTINEADREVDQMLADISELLKSLLSHQRIRNSYIAAGSRNPASPSPMLSAMVGTSTAPSAEETGTYKALRSQLAQMISKLPPYAVAKLDGEQLEDLAISKNMVIHGKEYQGTMEEDHLTRAMKATMASQATNTLSRTGSGADHSTSAGQFGRTPSVSNRSAHAPSTSYYGSRTPAAGSYARTGASQPFNAPATAPRQPYTNTYNPVASTTRPSSFTQPNSHFYSRPNYGSQYGASTPQAPSNPARPNYASVPQTTFAPRTSTFAPPSAQTTYTPQANYTAPRPSYAASTATPSYAPRPQAYGQQGGRTTPTFAPNQQTPSAVGPSGFHSTLTTEQQREMMERQRAALARQGGGQAPPAPMNGGV